MKGIRLVGVGVLAAGLLVLLLWGLGAGVRPAAGAVAQIVVNTTDDELNEDGDCSLREAIEAANNDQAVDVCPGGFGADTVILGPGVYQLSIPGAGEDDNQTGDLDILEALTITGAGPALTIIDANQLDRALDVDQDANSAWISGLTIRNGNAPDGSNGGGIETYEAALTLVDVIIQECTAANYGGGMRSAYASTTLSGTQFLTNTATRGGGIYVYGGDLLLQGSQLVGNSGGTGSYGGGLYLSNNAAVTLDGADILSNTATYGGGISLGDGTLTVLDAQVRWNNATNGGGLHVRSGGGATLGGGQLADNTATGSGGGVFIGNGTVALSGGEIARNEALLGGGVAAGQASAVFSQSAGTAIMHNTATLNGGGIHASEGTVSLLGGTVYSNTALGGGDLEGGGGLYVAAGSAVLDGGEIRENAADHGAGAYLVNLGGLTLTDGEIADNVAGVEGGGVYLRSGLLTQEGGYIRYNSAGSGGGVYSYQGGVVLTAGNVYSNTATGTGGGIMAYHTTSSLQMSGGQIVENRAASGGGLYVEYGTATLSGGRINANTATISGGGVYLGSGTAVLTQTAGTINLNDASQGGGLYIGLSRATLGGGVSYNTADDGGGIYLDTGTLSLEQAFVYENDAVQGAGIYNRDGDATVVNATISNNSATAEGGGIYHVSGSTLITFTTIAGNGGRPGPGIYLEDAYDAPVVLNTILANGTGNCNMALVSNGYNLESGDTCGLGATGDMTATNPLLESPVSVGGTIVRPLVSESPALDHGLCVAGIDTDQRGATRPMGAGCDIGAYELDYWEIYLPLVLR